MTTGYRFWRVVDSELVSPFAYVVLPEDGLMVADCGAHEPPGLTHGCGITYYPTRGEAEQAARWLHPDPHAITEGTITGPVRPEVHMRPYRVGPRWVSNPMGKRCAEYQVTTIYTDVPVFYGMPVHTLDVIT